MQKQLKAILEESPEIICYKYFKDDEGKPFVCTSYQAEFLRKILNRKTSRFIVSAATGSGKSEIIALAISLLALLGKGEKIAVVSHTQDQSEIIFSKAKKHLVEDSPVIRAFVDTSKEFSRRMIFLKNGSHIRCFSSGVSEFGSESLLGFHCNILVIDESASIDDDIYSQKILRMLGSAKDGLLIESGTPHKRNHFFTNWNNPRFLKFHWPWKIAVKEGRLNQELVKEQKSIMTSSQFFMWYEAEFPDQSEKALFDVKEIERNLIEPWVKCFGKKILSCDIARDGSDSSVFTLIDYAKGVYRVRQIYSYEKSDTMQSTGRIKVIAKEFKVHRIIVDATGLGAGVVDRLNEIGFDNVEELIAGGAAENDDKFANLKAELYVRAKTLFERDKLRIIANEQLIKELTEIQFDYTSDGRLKIVDPRKSPDFADSLVYGLCRESGRLEFLEGFDKIFEPPPQRFSPRFYWR